MRNYDNFSLLLSTLLLNLSTYAINTLLEKCTMTTTMSSDIFFMINHLLETLLPNLDRTYQDPNDLIKDLTAKKTKKYYIHFIRSQLRSKIS